MNRILVLLVLLIYSSTFAQNRTVDSLRQVLNTELNPIERSVTNLSLAKEFETIDLEKGKQYARAAIFTKNDSIMAEVTNQLGRFCFFTSELDSAKYYFEEARKYLSKMKDERRMAIVNISIGAIELRNGDYNSTIKTLTESLRYFEKEQDELNAAKCYSNMSAAFAELENFSKAIEYNEKALEVFNKNKLAQYQLITLPNLAAQYLKTNDTIKAIEYNQKAEELALRMNNKRSLSIIYNNLGSVFLDKDETKARNYLLKALQLKNELNLKNGIEVTQGNLAYLFLKNHEYEKALQYYQMAEQQAKGKQLVFTWEQIKKCFIKMGRYSKALDYAEKARKLNDSILSIENQKIFNEIQAKYETEKKERNIFKLEAQNLETDNKRKQNLILFFAVLIVLIAFLILVYFILRESKKKQKIDKQKLLQRLKEQELKGIDAIIDAQEKEQQRIANELHDNLGSRMATLRLFIDESKNKTGKKEKEEHLEHLQKIADETYQEVRKIAHENNTGAFITQGLIPSVQVMANQLAESDGLQVKVININIRRRVKNSIEIQIFRIIQELLTNIIKHAKANEVTIQFSEDENQIEVMIEDNGIGFNIQTTTLGFGLTNIEARLENLNGTINIDSAPGNGTTIIITIPL